MADEGKEASSAAGEGKAGGGWEGLTRANQDASAGDDPVVEIAFRLPSGDVVAKEFKLGQTVEVLKAFLDAEHGLAMAEHELSLGDEGTTMIDPLSLSDYQIQPGAKVAVNVAVAGGK